MAKGKFISYLRVSTDKQGRSGLGLEAQREAVTRYLNGGNWTVVAEYVETESGKRSDRPKLAAALSHAKAIGATLVFAKLDPDPQCRPAAHACRKRRGLGVLRFASQ